MLLDNKAISQTAAIIVAVVIVVAVVGGGLGIYFTTLAPTPTEAPTVGTGWEWEKENLPDKIGLAYDFAACETPFFGGIRQDVFYKEGIPESVEFEIFPCESVAELREAIHAGHAKFGFCAYEFFPVVDSFGDFYYANGLHTGCIVSCVSNELWDQGVRDEASFMEWIKEGKASGELRQINVGQYGNSPFWWLAVMMDEHGLDIRTDVEITVTDPAAVPAAMKAGKMDVAFEWDPIPRIVEWEGAGHILIDQGVDEPWSNYYCCFLGVNKDFYDTYPEATKKIMKGVMEYGLYVKYHPHEAAQDYISFGPELCPYAEDELVEMYAHYKYDIMSDYQMAYDTFGEFWERLYAMGFVVHDTDWAFEHGYIHLDVMPTGTMTDGRITEKPDYSSPAYGE